MLNYVHPEVLVDTQWLSDHLNDPNLRLIEVDLNPQKYHEGHIPGAIYWNPFSDFCLLDFRMNFDRIAMKKLLDRSGITNDTTIIFYLL